jgi:predicted nucleic acid-binding Zn ribbon protein
MGERRCFVCKASLAGRRSDAVVCSAQCNERKRVGRRRKPVTPKPPCPTCGGEVSVDRGHLAVYCGERCQRTARYRRQYPWTTEIRACAVCGEAIRRGRSDAKYCSVDCRKTAHRQRWSKPRTSLKSSCPVCGIAFVGDVRATYCSVACRYQARRTLRRDETLEQGRRWRRNRQEKARQELRRWQEANKEAIRAYRAMHAERYAEYSRRGRLRKELLLFPEEWHPIVEAYRELTLELTRRRRGLVPYGQD